MTAAEKRGRASWGLGRDGCTWCGGGGTVSSSIDIRQPECPCVMELDREEDPELAALDAALDAERERRRDPATALLRITAHLARYTCAGPIPLTFAATLGSDGGIDIIATAHVEDCDRPGVMIDVPTRGGVRVDASDVDIDLAMWRISAAAYDHELHHYLLRDGVPARAVQG